MLSLRLTNEERNGTGERYAYDLCGNRLKKQGYHYTLTAERTPESVIDDEESYCYNERNELIKRINAGNLLRRGRTACRTISERKENHLLIS